MTILEARQLFAGYGERIVLDGIDVTLERGARVALIGPNGSGKTTLVRVLAGIVPPARGRVLLDGHDLAKLSTRERARRVAIVPQNFSTAFAFTAREIVGLGRTAHAKLFGGRDSGDRAAIEKAMSDVDAIALADRQFAELSGGERQRIILAMALAQQPDVLLLDEPTTHLDLGHELSILELVDELGRVRGLTVLAVLHDIALAASHFERVVVLENGRIAADGPAHDVVTGSLLARVFGVSARVYWHEGMAAIVPQDSSAGRGRSAS